MKHILGVEGTWGHTSKDGEYVDDYEIKIEVSQDVIDWLNSHDIKVKDSGYKYYIVNDMEYEYIGKVPVEKTDEQEKYQTFSELVGKLGEIYEQFEIQNEVISSPLEVPLTQEWFDEWINEIKKL